MSDKAKLLAFAELQRGTVKIGDTKFIVQEVELDDFIRYGALVKEDQRRGTAFLLQKCVIDDAGAPLLTDEEATKCARSTRVSMPLVQKIMELSGSTGITPKKD